MTVRELSKEQLVELKQNWLCSYNPSVSYGELADADETVTDDFIFEEYGGTEFTDEDFACSGG